MFDVFNTTAYQHVVSEALEELKELDEKPDINNHWMMQIADLGIDLWKYLENQDKCRYETRLRKAIKKTVVAA